MAEYCEKCLVKIIGFSQIIGENRATRELFFEIVIFKRNADE